MVKKIINIDLDLKRVSAQPKDIPQLVEGDNGNVFVITLTDDGVPVDLSGCRILAVFSKVSDGTTAEQDTDDAHVDIGACGITLTGIGTISDEDTITVSSTLGVVTATTDIIGMTAEVDKDTFLSVYPEDGVYVFTYNSNAWQYGENSVRVSGDNHNIITIDLKNSSYGAGKNVCELQIYSNIEVLVTTAQFNFDGRKGISNNDTVRRSSEYPILASLIIQAAEALAMAYPWAHVTVTAVSGNEAGVNVVETDENVEIEFEIPNGVYVGDGPPSGDAEVWIIPGGEGGQQEGTVMSTEVYDQDNDGIVDNSEKLGGQLPSYYATATALAAEVTNRQNAVSTEVNDRNSAIATSIQTNVTAREGSASGLATLDTNAKVNAYQATAHVFSIDDDTTLALTHAGGFLNSIATSDIEITVPSYANVAFPVDTEIIIFRYETGKVTITPGGGVTICTAVSPITVQQYSAVGLKKIATDVWAIFGV